MILGTQNNCKLNHAVPVPPTISSLNILSSPHELIVSRLGGISGSHNHTRIGIRSHRNHVAFRSYSG